MPSFATTSRAAALLVFAAFARGAALSAQAAAGPAAGWRATSASVTWFPTSSPRADHLTTNHWQRGAIIGGVAGAALAVLYNAAIPDSEHQSLRVVELTFIGVLIGGMIGAR